MQQVERLIDSLVPSDYQITINLYESKLLYDAAVKIEAQTAAPTTSIKLHSLQHKIVSATINSMDCTFKADEASETIQLQTPEEVNGKVTIDLQVEGSISKQLHGLYASYIGSGQDRQLLVTTQFESTHAREVFPCVDEPAAKAKFDLTVTCERDMPVISNGTSKVKELEDGRYQHRFSKTPIMSTYLLALISGPLEYLESSTASGTIVRTWASESGYKSTQFALETAVACLNFFEEYFDIAYPLDDCDLVAIPDFNSGAMENWGCITFRETALISDEHTSLVRKKIIAEVVCHELAHQWFGNLVTMAWWDDLWLNEGFATFAAFMATDHIHPEYDMWQQFHLDEVTRAMQLDSLRSSHPIIMPINDPEEIRTIFDAVSYSKGASVIRMLQKYVGEEPFRDGLRHYLKKHSYQNTTTNDLWDSVSEVAEQDVRQLMDGFTKRMGFPVVDVTVRGDTVSLAQQRFLRTAEPADEENYLWNIPFEIADNKQLLSKRQAKVDGGKAFLQRPTLSSEASSYLITRFSTETLSAISEIENLDLSQTERIALASSAELLLKSGRITAAEFLDQTETLRDGLDHDYLSIMAGGVAGLTSIFDKKVEDTDIRKRCSEVFRPMIDEAGFFADAELGGGIESTELKTELLSIANFYRDERLDSHAENTFEIFIKSGDLDQDMGTILLMTSMRLNEDNVFPAIWQSYIETDSPQLKSKLRQVLTAARDEENVAKLLEAVIKAEDIRTQDGMFVVINLIMPREAKMQTFKFIAENFKWFEDTYRSDLVTFTYLVKVLGSSFSDEAMYKKVEQVYASFDHNGMQLIVEQARENFNHRIYLRQAGLKLQ